MVRIKKFPISPDCWSAVSAAEVSTTQSWTMLSILKGHVTINEDMTVNGYWIVTSKLQTTRFKNICRQHWMGVSRLFSKCNWSKKNFLKLFDLICLWVTLRQTWNTLREIWGQLIVSKFRNSLTFVFLVSRHIYLFGFAWAGELAKLKCEFRKSVSLAAGSTLLSRDDPAMSLCLLFISTEKEIYQKQKCLAQYVFQLMVYLTNRQVKAVTLLIVSFILVPGSETQVQAVCVNPLVRLVHRPDEAADLGEGGRPVPLTLPTPVRARGPPVVVAEEAEDQAHELHLLLRFNGHQFCALVLGEAEGSSIVPGHEVAGVEEEAAHAR